VTRDTIPRQHHREVIRDVGAIADVEAGVCLNVKRLCSALTRLSAVTVAKWKICRRAISFSLTALYNLLRSSHSFAERGGPQITN